MAHPPPAYKDPATVPAETAPAETAPAETEQPPPSQETKPAEPSGKASSPSYEAGPEQGVLGAPLTRIMFIGVVLILYFILAFWIPVYMMAGAADPCNRNCATRPVETGLGCEGAAISGSTQCEANCEAACELFYASDDLKEAYQTGWESAWFAESIESRLASWTLVVLGMVFGLIACIMAYFALRKEIAILKLISAGLLALGGVLLGIGGLVFNATWYMDGFEASDTEDIVNAARAANTFEFLLPASIAVILGLDLLDMVPVSLNDEKMRNIIMTAPFAVIGISAGFCYAYIVNWEPDDALSASLYDFPLADVLGCVSAGYFIMAFMAIARILIFGEFVKVSQNPAQVVVIKFIVTILLIIGAFICAVGYWAFVDKLFDCDYNILIDSTVCESAGYISYTFGDGIGPAYMAVYDLPYEGNLKCYYVAYSFFILGMGGILAYDMGIVENYKAVVAAQKAASAANA